MHLNPLKTKRIKSVADLGRDPLCGHSVIMGESKKILGSRESVIVVWQAWVKGQEGLSQVCF